MLAFIGIKALNYISLLQIKLFLEQYILYENNSYFFTLEEVSHNGFKSVLSKMTYPTGPMPLLSLSKKCRYCKKLSITPTVTVQFP